MNISIIFRDKNGFVAGAVTEEFLNDPEWDVANGDIFEAGPAEFLVSPANCTGRMDGGIDQIYINRFGWQLERRLMRDIVKLYGGKLAIGEAHAITTYDPDFPMMISAPTMEWPPGDISQTQNAYLAFSAALKVAKRVGQQVHGDEPVKMLLPGLGTLTGGMNPEVFAKQLRRAWDEHKAGFRTYTAEEWAARNKRDWSFLTDYTTDK